LPARSVVLAEDETDLLLFPPLRATWSPRGLPKEVLLCGRNGRRVVFRAMNLRTGHRLLLRREHQRATDFRAFLRVVRSSYRGWHLAMVLDEDPSHTAKGSVRLADEFGIELLWLPKRAPQLNPMDTLWGQAKDVVSADKQYATARRAGRAVHRLPVVPVTRVGVEDRGRLLRPLLVGERLVKELLRTCLASTVTSGWPSSL
jgi:hypothetical protein